MKYIYIFLNNNLKKIIISTFILISLNLSFSYLYAQDLEPGFLSAMPIGGNFAIGSYSRSGGNILIDNTPDNVIDGLRERRSREIGDQQEQQQNTQAAAAQTQKLKDDYNKDFTAYLEGKGYTVK